MLRTAIIADWLPTFGGAEHVIAELCELWPDAPLHTTVAKHGKLGPLDAKKIHTSTLQKWYRLCKNHKVLLPFMPRAIERIDTRGYDVIVSSSHAVGKAVIPAPSAVHVCYCHTPMRYAWEMEGQYLKDFRVPKRLMRRVRQMLSQLRKWDLGTAKRVDVFIANSSTVQERIQRIYNRESVVIHPPVSEHFFAGDLAKNHNDQPYFLALGRLVPYKRFDLLIEAANTLGFRLKVAGSGDDFERLQKMAGPTVEMLGFVADEDVPGLYRDAKAFLFPQFEDAGVAPLEAQACGTPVIAYGKGGALDTVVDSETGVFFAEQTVSSLEGAIEKLETISFDSAAIRRHAEQYRASRFRERVAAVVDETLKEYKR